MFVAFSAHFIVFLGLSPVEQVLVLDVGCCCFFGGGGVDGWFEQFTLHESSGFLIHQRKVR